VLFSLALAGLGSLAVLWLAIHAVAPVSLPPVNAGVIVYDKWDRQVCTIFGDRDQQPVPLKRISISLQHAIVTSEDRDFFGHEGIDPLGITRAILADIMAHKMVQGGSTISQQLVKNLHFEGKKRGLIEKVEEALMALRMEQSYSKTAILECYLNTVYFGNGVYGAQRAAQRYFGKNAADLDLAQAAFLAGLVTAPSELGTPAYRTRAIARQQQILKNMQELGYATADQVKAASKEKLVFRSTPSPISKYRYYLSEVLQSVHKTYGDKMWSPGMKIYTNLDPVAQELAQKTLASGIKHAPPGIDEGALVSISVADGGVIAMVGGAGTGNDSEWNRALSPHTAGSAFKPFVYLAGLQTGVLQPDTTLVDEPIEIQIPGSPAYRPRDFDGQFLGEMTIRKAIALSRNIPAVRVASDVGPENIVKVAEAAGITSKLDPTLSLALGASAVTPLDMANAYATLARGGTYVTPFMIRKVEDNNGTVLQSFESERRVVFAQEPVAELVDALEDVVERGTGTKARLFDRPVAGKTGTADEAKDIWFIGFTPDTVTAVWGGNDENRPVAGSRVTGGSVMAGIWQSYMRAFYDTHPVPAGEFIAPEHPLAQEVEPIHFLPSPAGIFGQLFGMPPTAPDRTRYPATAPERIHNP
jgi:penicillin-binding protein 1A